METDRALDTVTHVLVAVTRTQFQTLLDVHPEIRTVLQQRLQLFPEYTAWLQEFSPEVLAALNNTSTE